MGQVNFKSKEFITDMEHAAVLMSEFEKLNEVTQYCFMCTCIDTYCKINDKDYKEVIKEYKKDRAAADKEDAQFIEL